MSFDVDVQEFMDLQKENARLTKRLQKAERERDELRAWKTATHEQWAAWTRDDFKARAEAAEAREAALREALERIGWHELTWKEARDAARAALAAGEPPLLRKLLRLGLVR